MSSADKNLSDYRPEEIPSAQNFSFGIVTAAWNQDITNALYEGCKNTLLEHGCSKEQIHSLWVPGTFELPTAARLLAQNKKVDAVICIGCVIKGETSHNEYINQSVAMALQQLSIASAKPFIFGVLTPNSMQQALDRAGGKHGNKGVESAVTAIQMAELRKNLSSTEKKIGFSFGL
ncbi:6,7-dimethyl-8-ribityllumazine synthase [Saprospira grandis DSM 2844]|uniref:6,7-dimethyl-8-ribityllumazine synthase n=1 Tax=Saprospira grandis DSM 2844 TaxID=694433 RepID=J0XXS5_9BACT|nr:6,7-dimethyl-8-ribityllumazine synthase [Saprospira grandis]EJF53901.1 6,7-dimethyl-8-ribityllumazine synthase [Saprospira grandis DSM 2844]